MKSDHKETNQDLTLHFRNLKLSHTNSTAFPQALYTPAVDGLEFIVRDAFVEIKAVAHAVAPHIVIDNGTDGQDIVADVALGVTAARVQNLTVVSSRIVDIDNPLRIKLATSAADSGGTAVHTVDVVIRGWLKSV